MIIKPITARDSVQNRVRSRTHNVYDRFRDGERILRLSSSIDVTNVPNAFEQGELTLQNSVVDGPFGLNGTEVINDELYTGVRQVSAELKELLAQRPQLYRNYRDALSRYYEYRKKELTKTCTYRLYKDVFVPEHLIKIRKTVRRRFSLQYLKLQGYYNPVFRLADVDTVYGRAFGNRYTYMYSKGTGNWWMTAQELNAPALKSPVHLNNRTAIHNVVVPKIREEFLASRLSYGEILKALKGNKRAARAATAFPSRMRYKEVIENSFILTQDGFVRVKHVKALDVVYEYSVDASYEVGGYWRRQSAGIRRSAKVDYVTLRRDYQLFKAAMFLHYQYNARRLTADIKAARARLQRVAKATYHLAEFARVDSFHTRECELEVHFPRSYVEELKRSDVPNFGQDYAAVRLRFAGLQVTALCHGPTSGSQTSTVPTRHGYIAVFSQPSGYAGDPHDYMVVRADAQLQPDSIVSCEHPSDLDLRAAVRSTALAIKSGRFNDNYGFLLARSIAELKDLPATKDQARDFIKFLKSRPSSAKLSPKLLRGPLKHLAGAYLAWKFAIQPTIDDVTTVITETMEYITTVQRSLEELLWGLVKTSRNSITVRKAFRIGPKIGDATTVNKIYDTPRIRARAPLQTIILHPEDSSKLADIVRSLGWNAAEPHYSNVMLPMQTAWVFAYLSRLTSVELDETYLGNLYAGHIEDSFDSQVSASVDHAYDLLARGLRAKFTNRILPVDLRLFSRYRGHVFARFTPSEIFERLTDLSTIQKLITKIQPAYIAWELYPLSFVMDWLTSTKRSVMALNDALGAFTVPYALRQRFWASICSELLLAAPDLVLEPSGASMSSATSGNTLLVSNTVSLESSGRARWVRTDLKRMNRGPIVDAEWEDILSLIPTLQVKLNTGKVTTLCAMIASSV